MGDEDWAFVAWYLILLPLDAEQRKRDLRGVFNALRWLVRPGAPWRYLPNDLPRWEAVYQQSQRWINAGSFEATVQDLRALLRLAQGREPDALAAIFDARTMQSIPESGARAGYDGHKRKKGSKVHAAFDTLGHLLAMHVSYRVTCPPLDRQDRVPLGPELRVIGVI